MRSFCSFFSCVLLLWPALASAEREDIVVADLEQESYPRWQIEGSAFGKGPTKATRLNVSGYRGRYLASSITGGDAAVGTITSPEFTISRKYVTFLIGGGRHPGQTGAELLVDGKSVRTATGIDSDVLEWRSWDVAEYSGKQARVRLFDKATGDWGHIDVDHLILTDQKRTGVGTIRLADYRKSPEYYRELYRPQFHFTPEMNWMNDPNGLVYFEGEYHLFYQHNPHGNAWGHMSWGHAVSKDLVHWEHLPIALHEEYGVMIFSGSAVVDWKNTSGFGTNNKPPLVAIYTGHGHSNQTQDIAFSNDRGRTWTKYPGNPVIDLKNPEFRDPKVFWHDPTERWIMVVSLAKEKRLQFYGSTDLKAWKHLSDFGPGGVAGKPNWECPDLFELPIENEPGKTRWVLEVDMGNAAVAGGSGGEYFIGDFDGKAFHCDHDINKSYWVDYGRDFYAPVSWSDIPASDGRRIWIGWMNNWETHLVPTSPWRSAMSIPRTLSLSRTTDGLRLVQQPVEELKALRTDHVRLEALQINDTTKPLAEKQVSGDQFEMIVEFELGDAVEFGVNVRAGDEERTVVGYDATRSELFVDRTHSGESSFHDKFAGRHAAPLRPTSKKVSLRILVDSSSIEVFGENGKVVITDRIFPRADSQSISLYAKGGAVSVRSIEFWRLASSWKNKPPLPLHSH